MSYDIYLYKSKSGKPDVDEANAFLEEMDSEKFVEGSDILKQNICKALVDFNPRLEPFVFDYNEVARLQKISVEQAKQQFNHIEINTPENDLATQITICDSYVFLTIPYWYSGEKAKELFNSINNYLKVIHKASGYFVYDPQNNDAFNPLEKNLDGQELYERGSAHIQNLSKEGSNQKKPWWKFW